jgi:hypothetical protein
VARAPQRVAADYLAFYQTAAFAAEERWSVRWLAPVYGYRLATRRELLPEEPDHPRAAERYYRVEIGRLMPLPHPVPSKRLRRITFIATTLARLYEAEEINDLWVKGHGQERLWAALKQADLDAERQYPLREDAPEHVADFALFCRAGQIAVIVTDEPQADGGLREPGTPDYLLAAGGWHAVHVTQEALAAAPLAWAARLAELAARLGGAII